MWLQVTRASFVRFATERPRRAGFVGLVSLIFAVAFGIVAERVIRLSSIVATYPGLAGRELRTPNYHHVWFTRDLALANGRGLPVCGIGRKLLNDVERPWSSLCPLDDDEDGMTNGQELGDPCCLWTPPSPSELASGKRLEYRRWGLTHPNKADTHVPDLNSLREPVNCSNDDADLYQRQFRNFFFHDFWMVTEEPRVVPVKVVSLLVLLALLFHWFRHRGLLGDVCPPLVGDAAALSRRTSLAVCALSFVYMDLTSGIVHLILDYAPPFLPGLGDVARGFQYHHEDPTAIVRMSWYAYVSHVHLLCPLVAALILLSDASRVQRLFWFWGSVNVHLFQTTHRWAHFPPETLSWLVRTLQAWGLLLSQERHMSHHDDLESQFTILAGHGDLILDPLSRLVPPTRYDLWLIIGCCWFVFPFVLDMWFRPAMEALELPLGRGGGPPQIKAAYDLPTGQELRDLEL